MAFRYKINFSNGTISATHGKNLDDSNEKVYKIGKTGTLLVGGVIIAVPVAIVGTGVYLIKKILD
jgi:hypothetical protein